MLITFFATNKVRTQMKTLARMLGRMIYHDVPFANY